MEGEQIEQQPIEAEHGDAMAGNGSAADAAEKRGRHRVYVANLPPKITRAALEETFSRISPVVGVLISTSEKYAFIDFESPDAADKVVAEMQGFVLNGSQLKVEIGKSERRRATDQQSRTREERRRTARTRNRIMITGLNPSTSWQDLKDAMRGTGGDVTFTSVNKNREGFAEFATDTDVERAIEKLNNSEIAGYRVQVRRDDMPDRELERDQPARGGRDDRRRKDSDRRRRPRSRSPSRRHRGRSRERRRSRSRRSPDDSRSRRRDRDERDNRDGGNSRGRRRGDSASSASGSRSPRRTRRGSRSD